MLRFPSSTRALEQVVAAFENSKGKDIPNLPSYIDALTRLGRQNQIPQRLAGLYANAGDSNIGGDNQKIAESTGNIGNNGTAFDSLRSRFNSLESAARAVNNSGSKSFGSQMPNSRYSFNPSTGTTGYTSTAQADPHESVSPLHVIVSERWSWTKWVRQTTSRLFFGLLFFTGVAVLLEQQGMLKQGKQALVAPEPGENKVRFSDVQGVDEAKHELQQVVDFLKDPARFTQLGGRLPKGVLLYGPPGTGKTYLARAIAGEADVPFFQTSGSEFDEMFVGVGARRVRELFVAAKKAAPCIVFIDELDAVGSKRNAKDQSYMRQTLNQLLVELDGFEENSGVILVAATNSPESLDKALVRPGRFDKLVAVPLPDVRGRSQILKVHMKGITVGPSVDPVVIARGTPGLSGADLANLINQAAIRAATLHAPAVELSHLEWAKDKIQMGAERHSAVITQESKRLTAYHEGGHALVALYTQAAMPLHKVTVIPRGSALGLTVQLPENDILTHTRAELLARLDVCMGGRVAEELIYGPLSVTTGASSDLQSATMTARQMVMAYGMSDNAGLVQFDAQSFADASPATKSLIEVETSLLLAKAYERAKSLLKTRESELHRLATALIEHETLDLDQVKIVVSNMH